MFVYFVRPLEYLIKEIPVSTKRATIILIKVKFCNVSGMYSQLSKISSELHDPDTLYLRQQGCKDQWLFFEAKRGPWAKKLGQHCSIFVFISTLFLPEEPSGAGWATSNNGTLFRESGSAW